MRKDDRVKFIEILSAMALNFGGELSDPLIGLWFKMFSDWPIEKFEAAAKSVIATRVYRQMPTVAEVRLAGDGHVDDRAQIEADKVFAAVQTVGAYNSIAFDDPITIQVVRQGFGGWIKLCSDLVAADAKWFVKDFVRIYAAYSRAGISGSGHLSGIVERDNTANGHLDHIPAPVLIGDKKEASRLAHGIDGAPSRKLKSIAMGIGNDI